MRGGTGKLMGSTLQLLQFHRPDVNFIWTSLNKYLTKKKKKNHTTSSINIIKPIDYEVFCNKILLRSIFRSVRVKN